MSDQEREAVFVELMRHSWERYDEAFDNDRLDDVLLGAVVASMVRAGYLLIGMNSDGTNHHIRLERPDNQDRLVFRLNHLTEDLAVARVRGHLGNVVLGYGRRVAHARAVWSAFQPGASAPLTNTSEPGAILFDADLAAGYIYSQVMLVLDLDRYLGNGLVVDLTLFRSHLDAVVHCLARFLDERLGARNDPGPRTTAHRRELDEARDEILMGHIIADMADAGHAVIGVAADSEYQRVRFRPIHDPTFYSVLVALDRTSDRFSSNVGRNLATLTVQAEVKRRLPRPGDLLAAWADDARLVEAAASRGARVERKLNSLFATTRKTVAFGDPLAGDQKALSRGVLGAVDELRSVLAPTGAVPSAAD